VNRSDVNDIVQEAWAEILTSIGSFRPEKGTFNQWACGVAHHVTCRYIRDAKRYAERFSEYHPNVDEHASPEPTPERCVQLKQTSCRLSSAAQGLKDRPAKVLMLHALDDRSHKEIAAALEITEDASQKCYQRARDNMAQCMADEALCVMPALETSCNDCVPANDGVWQWIRPGQWAHYSGQISAAIIAFLLFIPSNRLEQQQRASITGSIRTAAQLAMYRFDKQKSATDKPVVYPDPMADKPQPTFLPGVRAVSAPTRFTDKPTYTSRSAPLPPYQHAPRSADHSLFGR